MNPPIQSYLAIDLGAESGRAVLGIHDGETLTLREISRFPNGPKTIRGTLRWDAFGLFSAIKQSIRQAFPEGGEGPASIGLDTWGVDFGLLDRHGQLIDPPFHYRDARTNRILTRTFEILPAAEIFTHTGIQFMQFNTLFQLMAMKLQGDVELGKAGTLLMMPDLFNYWLTGRMACERTIASTSQCYDPKSRQWAFSLLDKLGLPAGIFPEIIDPGSVLGTLKPELAEGLGVPAIPVIAPGCHDTASAVAAVPVGPEYESDFAYISSGTWSLIGAEIPEAVINQDSLAFNITNETGVENTIRFLKNLAGLWLVQECRRTWKEQGQELSYDELTRMATEAPAFQSLVDPDDSTFLAPGDMPARIQEFCRRTGQQIPESKSAIVRCALESLALKTRWVIDRLAALLGRKLPAIHIVGGGTQNRLLNQFIAEATARPIYTGPVEATAIGNILMQMLAQGRIASLREGRDLVRRSFPMETYLPQDPGAWEDAYRRFQTWLA